MSAELDFARRVSIEAGEIVRRYFGQGILVDMKAWADPVTAADRTSESYIREQIAADYPDDGILGEEEGLSPGRSGRVWVVDPLDGTANFAGGLTIFAVCITLLDRDGRPLVNVTHDPIQRETFAAERGHGATLNDRPIQVSPSEHLAGALVHLAYPRDRRLWLASLELARRVTAVAPHARNVGSSALAQAYVASGRLHAHARVSAGEYDIIGGNLLIEEAGGVVTDLAGEPFLSGVGSLLAASPPVHRALMALDLASTLDVARD